MPNNPHDDLATDAAIIQYVSTCVPNMTGGNYNSPVSTGVAHDRPTSENWNNKR